MALDEHHIRGQPIDEEKIGRKCKKKFRKILETLPGTAVSDIDAMDVHQLASGLIPYLEADMCRVFFRLDCVQVILLANGPALIATPASEPNRSPVASASWKLSSFSSLTLLKAIQLWMRANRTKNVGSSCTYFDV